MEIFRKLDGQIRRRRVSITLTLHLVNIFSDLKVSFAEKKALELALLISERRMECGPFWVCKLFALHILTKSAWLSIIASKNTGDKVVSIADIVKDHWKQFGRNFYCRYDYESVSADGANEMMNHLRKHISELKKGDKLGNFETPLEYADEFEYKDPVDGSISSRQV